MRKARTAASYGEEEGREGGGEGEGGEEGSTCCLPLRSCVQENG